jgi:hypothetical protein
MIRRVPAGNVRTIAEGLDALMVHASMPGSLARVVLNAVSASGRSLGSLYP